MIEIIIKTILLAISFPIAGILSRTIAGPLDNLSSSFIGGIVVGGVLGFALSVRIYATIDLKFILFSSLALGVGNLIASLFVNFDLDLKSLLLFGFISGLSFATAQYLATNNLYYSLIVLFCWTIGWPIMSLIGVDIEKQYHIFGIVSALLFSTILSVSLSLGLIKIQ